LLLERGPERSVREIKKGGKRREGGRRRAEKNRERLGSIVVLKNHQKNRLRGERKKIDKGWARLEHPYLRTSWVRITIPKALFHATRGAKGD